MLKLVCIDTLWCIGLLPRIAAIFLLSRLQGLLQKIDIE